MRVVPTRITDGLFQADVVLPVQFHRRGRDTAEKRLMVAVLADAVDCFRQYACATDRRAARLFAEVDDWISCGERDWPFSFENICETLEIDSEYVRSGLERWRQRAAWQTLRSDT
jgi:hypothetical protein